MCNQTGGQIESTCEFYDSSETNHIGLVNDSPIPSGSTLALAGGDAKIVLEAGDIIKVQSNVASSIDVTLSYLEQT